MILFSLNLVKLPGSITGNSSCSNPIPVPK